MKTPIQELIEQLENLRDSISEDDAMYRGGVINSIRLAEGMLEREREVFNGAMGNLESEIRTEFITRLCDLSGDKWI